MKLTTAQIDRAAGVLLTTGCGDALGVPYEFATPPGPDDPAEMLGGGLGNGAPGEWSDDTATAVAIAEVAATGTDLASATALEAIAEGFLRWFAGDPPDVGIQTSAVLRATRHRLADGETGAARVMRAAAREYAARTPHSGGNGALMRTAGVALAHLGDCPSDRPNDRERCATAARLIAELTHADPLAGDSCVLWSEAIRVAVLEARVDVLSGLDLIPPARRDQWRHWLDAALDSTRLGHEFTPNGFTVTALQAAIAAITHTPVDAGIPCLHLQDALHAAVRIGHDTDTVAAIAGGLLGARWGASAVPWRWRRAVHGRDGADGRDLTSLAVSTTRGGDDPTRWPTARQRLYSEPAASGVTPHPHDPDVLLGTHRSRGHGATAVVAACRVGREQACFGEATVVVESRLIDSDHEDDNPNLAFVLYDAADAVRGLREEGHTVLLHCVAAQQRTPSIAAAYSVLLGHGPDEARAAVRQTLPDSRGRGRPWDAVGSVQDLGERRK